MKTKIVVVDDHRVISTMLANYINASVNYRVLYTSSNGKELLEQLDKGEELPSIILLDIHMPVMNGFQTMLKLKEFYPDIMVVILSMEDSVSSIIQFLRLGARSYLLKGMPSPEKVIKCFDKLLEQGFYYPKYITNKMINASKKRGLDKQQWKLSNRQIEFLKLATQTSKTYKEIANEMNVSVKTVENYQGELFKQFGVRNRPALMLYVQEYNIIGYKKH